MGVLWWTVTEVFCRVLEKFQNSQKFSVGYSRCHRAYRKSLSGIQGATELTENLCRVLEVSQSSQKSSVGYLQRVITPGTALWVPYRLENSLVTQDSTHRGFC